MEESTTITINHGGVAVAVKLPWDADVAPLPVCVAEFFNKLNFLNKPY